MHKYTLCVWKQPATKLSVGVGTCILFGLRMNSIVNPQQRKFPKVGYNIYEFYCASTLVEVPWWFHQTAVLRQWLLVTTVWQVHRPCSCLYYQSAV